MFGESRFAAFGLESVGGYHPAKLKDYNTFLSKTGNAAAIPVLQMLNVKYLISPQKINHPSLKLVKEGKMRSTRGEMPVAVFELENSLPRVWFVREAQSVPYDTIWKKIIQPDFDPRKTAYISEQIDISENSMATITQFDRTVHRFTISTESEGNQFLVLSEVYYPLRWKASIDGTPLETIKVNGIIRGVEVPAGTHTIEFKYDQTSFNIGVTISFISFGFSLLLVVLGYLKRKDS
ncbi:MAG: hypothetical protein CMG10_00230 [Candidatus Marinimicrobia bacterium]|nr:hypothetical protein [Candidatus Neomarinimicrobiota bacterium]